jgi:hypothetical protein
MDVVMLEAATCQWKKGCGNERESRSWAVEDTHSLFASAIFCILGARSGAGGETDSANEMLLSTLSSGDDVTDDIIIEQRSLSAVRVLSSGLFRVARCPPSFPRRLLRRIHLASTMRCAVLAFAREHPLLTLLLRAQQGLARTGP